MLSVRGSYRTKSIKYVCGMFTCPCWYHRRHTQTGYVVLLQRLWKVRRYLSIKFLKSSLNYLCVFLENFHFFFTQVSSTSSRMACLCFRIQRTTCFMLEKIERIKQSKIDRCRLCLDWTSFQENKGKKISFIPGHMDMSNFITITFWFCLIKSYVNSYCTMLNIYMSDGWLKILWSYDDITLTFFNSNLGPIYVDIILITNYISRSNWLCKAK